TSRSTPSGRSSFAPVPPSGRRSRRARPTQQGRPMAPDLHSPTPEELMEYLDGEGTAASRAAIDSHLVSCAACQALAAEQRAQSRDLAAWQVDPAPGTLRAPDIARTPDTPRTLDTARTPDTLRTPARLLAWVRQPRAAVMTFGAAAAALAIVVMGGGTMRRA